MGDTQRGIEGLMASLSPGNRSAKIENNPHRGHDSSSNEARDNGYSSTMGQPAPKRTASEHSTQSNNLLNLLRFNSSGSSQANQIPTISTTATGGTAQQAKAQNIHGRGVSSSDLVASFMGKPTISQSAGSAAPASMPDTHGSGANPQDYLLQLLNRTSTAQQARMTAQKSVSPVAETPVANSKSPSTSSVRTATIKKEASQEESTRQVSPIRVFGSQASRETTPFEPEVPVKKTTPVKSQATPIFNYVNPFEQLSAASPLNGRSGTTTPAREEKLKSTAQLSKIITPQTSKTTLNPNGQEILQSIEGSNSKSSSSKDRLSDLGAPTNDKATVAQALNEVGEQVNRQVEYALAQQQTSQEHEQVKDEVVESIEQQLQQAASEIKQELAGDEINTLSTLVSQEKAVEIKQILDEAAAGNVDGHHGSADDEGEDSGKAENEIEVPIFTFPMKPFVSIDIQGDQEASLSFRDGCITDIARLKKEFDQVDRILATASNSYIVYALPKPGGFRIIRQDDGVDRQAFKETRDHVFNVAISNEVHNRKSKIGLESCIGTAVSGSVYWATLRKDGGDMIEMADFERNTLVFPPFPVHDDNTSGGQLKTRAKRSSRHPDYFAIGRGKSIQIVYPLRALASGFVSEKGVVDTAKYFKNYTLKISMGKAGKDFVFSEDDTVIATLDKSGRLRLWDITEMIDDADDSHRGYSYEVTAPVLSFPTTSGSKSWPTSVLFVDKPRAYLKGCAQRYVLVGFKQNHTLQLWDLALGKAVQEINFPHEKESDAICSIGYHHHSSIVVVGHPTRNSIYFIHLSAPKYNLIGFTQAKYINRLSTSDPSVPKPESTAILSGIREYSFASKGHLRSVELVSSTADGTVDDERGLFELYAMHSKGVTCLSIHKADLGWTEDNKIIISKDAEKEGYIVLKDLQEPNPAQASEASSVNGEVLAPTPSRGQSKAKKSGETSSKLEAQLNSLSITDSITSAASPDKAEKRPKKKRNNAHLTEELSVPPPAPAPPTSMESDRASTLTVREAPVQKMKAEVETSFAKPPQQPKISPERSQTSLVVPGEDIALIKNELDSLREKINRDYDALDEKSREKQAEVLRLVAAQLGENVEQTLTRIVQAQIASQVIPSIHNVTTATLRSEIPEFLSKNLLQTLPSQLKLSLPEAVTKTISNPDVLKFMSEQITAKISSHVERQFKNSLQNTIIPSFQTMIIDVAQKKIQESEQRISQQIRLVNAQHDETIDKINQLTSLVQAFTETVHSMAASQAHFQSQILRQDSPKKESLSLSASSTEVKPLPAPELSPEQQEIQAIDEAMQDGNYEQGVIIWLQSKYQTVIFDDYFVRYDPKFLEGCSSLVALSVIAALTISLVNNIAQRLQWLHVILGFIDTTDPDIRDVTPKIMEVLIQRLEGRYMELSETNPLHPLLKNFPPLTRTARQLSARCSKF